MTLTKKCEAITVNADDIFLDPWNPRYDGLSEGIRNDYEMIRSEKVQAKCKERLVGSSSEGIDDVVRLMRAHGFECADRIIGVRFPDDESKILALEGNRRTAGLQQVKEETEQGTWAFTGDDAAEKLDSLEEIEILALPSIYFDDDMMRWQAQGLRHHKGISGWSPKRRHQHIRKLDEDGLTPSEIADMVGHTTGEVDRILKASKRFDAVVSAQTPYRGKIDETLYNYFADEGWTTKLDTWTAYNGDDGIFGNIDNLTLILQMLIDTPRQCVSMIELRDDFNKFLKVNGDEDEVVNELRDEPELTVAEATVRRQNRIAEARRETIRQANAAQAEEQRRQAEQEEAQRQEELERTPTNHVNKLGDFVQDLPSFSWVVGEHSIASDPELAARARELLEQLTTVCNALIQHLDSSESG